MATGRLSKILAAFALLCIYATEAVPTSSPIVDLGYATYEGILVQDTQTNQTNINFLGVRYAASPTGISPEVCPSNLSELIVHFYKHLGNLRFRAAQIPAFTPGVQMANAQPAMCLQAGAGAAAATPLRSPATSDIISRATESLAPSEDCLFLKYVHFSVTLSLTERYIFA